MLLRIHHLDLYRLQEGADLSILGIPEIYETSNIFSTIIN
jgi:tRNA A37 threonylcarbamoyladenosine biosynthesis protein TsaE